MKLLTRAKFALIYESQRKAVIETQYGHDSATIVSERTEAPVCQPATVEINGIVFHSKLPTSAAEAEKINEGIKDAMEMLPL